LVQSKESTGQKKTAVVQPPAYACSLLLLLFDLSFLIIKPGSVSKGNG